MTNEGDLVISSERFRDQLKNVTDCLDKLTSLLQSVATAPKPRRAVKPTKASNQRFESRCLDLALCRTQNAAIESSARKQYENSESTAQSNMAQKSAKADTPRNSNGHRNRASAVNWYGRFGSSRRIWWFARCTSARSFASPRRLTYSSIDCSFFASAITRSRRSRGSGSICMSATSGLSAISTERIIAAHGSASCPTTAWAYFI